MYKLIHYTLDLSIFLFSTKQTRIDNKPRQWQNAEIKHNYCFSNLKYYFIVLEVLYHKTTVKQYSEFKNFNIFMILIKYLVHNYFKQDIIKLYKHITYEHDELIKTTGYVHTIVYQKLYIHLQIFAQIQLTKKLSQSSG